MTLTVAPSRSLRWALVALHLLAGLAVLLADLAWPWRLALLLVVIASLAAPGRMPGGTTLRCQADGRLSVRRGDDWEPVELLADTVVLPWLIVLRYRGTGQAGVVTCLVLPDGLGHDEHRQLRVWLRWRGETAGQRSPQA